MLRTISALGGTTMFSAFSTARTEVSEWMEVHTPHTRPTKAHTSRGSRPRTIFSSPRTIVPELNASLILPFSISASIRRCPSIRVTGSTTILSDMIYSFNDIGKSASYKKKSECPSLYRLKIFYFHIGKKLG
jgi:hypothetical protein